MITLIFCIFIFTFQVIAFQPISSASFIKKSSSFKVSSVEKVPADFVKKQQLLKIDSDVILKTTTTSEEPISISLQNGTFLLNADSNYEAFYLNVTLDDSTYPLLIDTASPYIWVYGDDCSSDACSGKQLYTPSSTVQSTQTFQLLYSSSTASGYIQEFDLTINDELSIQNFNMGIAQSVPDIFTDYDISGVVGLPSKDDATLDGLQNLVEVLYQSGSIDKELFTMMINNGSSNYDGILTLGHIIDELYQGELAYTDIIDNDQSYWKIGIDNVYIDDYAITFDDEQTINNQQTNDSRLAIVDSGTTIMVLNKKDASKLHSFFENAVSDGTNFAIYCNETKEISFEIGHANFTLDSTSYLGTKYPESSVYNGYCVSNFQGLDIDNDGTWIIGGLFLKTVYTVFNYENKTIGFLLKNYNDIEISSVALTSTVTNSVLSLTSFVSLTTLPAVGQSSTSITNSSSIISSKTATSSSNNITSSTSNFSANNGVIVSNNIFLSFVSIIFGFIML